MYLKNLCVAVVCGAMVLGAGAVQAQDLKINLYVDGTLPFGQPKFVELRALADIPDLSNYALSRAGNGSLNFDAFTADHILPAVAVSADNFYYAVGNSFADQNADFDSIFPAKSGMRARNFGVNSNGDDVTGLFFHPTGDFLTDLAGVSFIDVVGELGTDGTGTAWEHLDSYIRSKASRAPSTTFDVNDWVVPGINFLDNLDAAGLAAAIPDMVIPEPASLVLMFAGLMGIAATRRR